MDLHLRLMLVEEQGRYIVVVVVWGGTSCSLVLAVRPTTCPLPRPGGFRMAHGRTRARATTSNNKNVEVGGLWSMAGGLWGAWLQSPRALSEKAPSPVPSQGRRVRARETRRQGDPAADTTSIVPLVELRSNKKKDPDQTSHGADLTRPDQTRRRPLSSPRSSSIDIQISKTTSGRGSAPLDLIVPCIGRCISSCCQTQAGGCAGCKLPNPAPWSGNMMENLERARTHAHTYIVRTHTRARLPGTETRDCSFVMKPGLCQLSPSLFLPPSNQTVVEVPGSSQS